LETEGGPRGWRGREKKIGGGEGVRTLILVGKSLWASKTSRKMIVREREVGN